MAFSTFLLVAGVLIASLPLFTLRMEPILMTIKSLCGGYLPPHLLFAAFLVIDSVPILLAIFAYKMRKWFKSVIFTLLVVMGVILGVKHAIDDSLYHVNPGTDLSGKVAVITGGNSGIGYTTALNLAHHGASVIIVCRNKARCEHASRSINVQVSPTEPVRSVVGDLNSLESMYNCSQTIQNMLSLPTPASTPDNNHEESAPPCTPSIDYLINNGGFTHVGARFTEDGLEAGLGAMHVSHFALTMYLLPLLGLEHSNPSDNGTDSSASRIITVSSVAHYFAHFEPSLFNNTAITPLPTSTSTSTTASNSTSNSTSTSSNETAHPYRPIPIGEGDLRNEVTVGRGVFGAYARAKLANVLFAYELQRRIALTLNLGSNLNLNLSLAEKLTAGACKAIEEGDGNGSGNGDGQQQQQQQCADAPPLAPPRRTQLLPPIYSASCHPGEVATNIISGAAPALDLRRPGNDSSSSASPATATATATATASSSSSAAKLHNPLDPGYIQNLRFGTWRAALSSLKALTVRFVLYPLSTTLFARTQQQSVEGVLMRLLLEPVYKLEGGDVFAPAPAAGEGAKEGAKESFVGGKYFNSIGLPEVGGGVGEYGVSDPALSHRLWEVTAALVGDICEQRGIPPPPAMALLAL